MKRMLDHRAKWTVARHPYHCRPTIHTVLGKSQSSNLITIPGKEKESLFPLLIGANPHNTCVGGSL